MPNSEKTYQIDYDHSVARGAGIKTKISQQERDNDSSGRHNLLLRFPIVSSAMKHGLAPDDTVTLLLFFDQQYGIRR